MLQLTSKKEAKRSSLAKADKGAAATAEDSSTVVTGMVNANINYIKDY